MWRFDAVASVLLSSPSLLLVEEVLFLEWAFRVLRCNCPEADAAADVPGAPADTTGVAADADGVAAGAGGVAAGAGGAAAGANGIAADAGGIAAGDVADGAANDIDGAVSVGDDGSDVRCASSGTLTPGSRPMLSAILNIRTLFCERESLSAFGMTGVGGIRGSPGRG